jgi:hypothetical protein
MTTGFDTRVFGPDIPVVVRNSHRFETYSCFGHWAFMANKRIEIKGRDPARLIATYLRFGAKRSS